MAANNTEIDPTPAAGIIIGDKETHIEEIHGDKVLQDKVLGDKITQYIFQGQVDAAERYKQFTELKKQPYLPDRPYTPIERPLFTGRDKEIRDILRYLGDSARQTIVIYGAPDVGKTSLIAAGIIPGLAIVGAVPLLLQDYSTPPGPVLKRDLLTQAAIQGYALEDAEPAQLMQQMITRSGQGIVLILDQLERAFLPDRHSAVLEELRRELGQILAALPAAYFHLLIAIREDMQFELDPAWRDLLPGLGQSVIYLEGLAIDEARAAIELPVTLAREDPQLFAPFYYDREGDVVNELILPDLDQLSSQEQKLILPADLQIVCYRLYEAAQEKEIPTIDSRLYWQVSNDKGAAYIIDDHFHKLLAAVPAANQELAQKISQAMLDNVDNFWSTPESLSIATPSTTPVSIPTRPLPPAAPDSPLSTRSSPLAIKETMDDMVRAGLLISHESHGQWAYAFAGNSIANAAARAAGPEYEKKLEARKQAGAIWRAWVVYDALAGKGQLRLIENYSQENDPLNVLLYLRSAVAHGMPVAPWLARLHNPEARQLLQRIEEQRTEDPQQSGAQSRRHRAEDLLGLLDGDLPQRPSAANAGPLTWTAAAHPADPVVRETAVLALYAAYREEEAGIQQQRDAWDRVESLWEADLISRDRLAELLGILSNADDHLARRGKKRGSGERFAIWRWRFGRYYNRDKATIWGQTAGGAAGAGLGLAILRAFLALFMPYSSGNALYFYFPVGFVLGGAVTFGVLMTNILRLQPGGPQALLVEKRPFLLTITLGALNFTLFHMLLGLLLRVGLIKAPLAHILSLAAGAALAFVIYDQPMAGWRGRAGQWLLRFASAAAVFALIQTYFNRYNDQAFSLLFSWNGSFYNQQLGARLANTPLAAVLSIKYWYDYFSGVDAALVGIFMALGLVIGLLFSARWLKNWQDLKVRAGE